MEYVDGEDLAQLLRRIGRFNAERATELARQLCLGLHAAHDKGVLHRDLKPANIMIDGRGKLLITDFGLAEIADDVHEDDIRSGTPAYMSPEQLAGREVTQRSDIYSLGIILHEIYTGKPVWEARSMAELLRKRNADSSPTPTSHVADLDPLVERVIQRCLDPNPERRPESALRILASLPGGDPLTAALQAGETPSPEMVAAAGDNTRVNPRLALLGLVTVALGLLLAVWLADRTSTLPQSSLDYEPAVLRHEVQQMLTEEFGYVEPPGEVIHGFRFFPGVAAQPMSYWYRQRPKDDMGTGFQNNEFWSSTFGRMSWVRPDFFQPSFDLPGEMSVILSGDKRLDYFRVKPDLNVYVDNAKSEPRWSEWFSPQRTGLYLPAKNGEPPLAIDRSADFQVLTVVNDRWWTPPDAYDALAVWEGRNPDGTTFLVEAAAWRGKPTYFRRFDGDRAEILPVYDSTRDGNGPRYVLLLIITLMFCGVVLAWQNLRSGRGDVAGGKRLAAYVGIIGIVALLSFCRFPREPVDIYANVIVMGLSQVLFEVVRTWVWYMALEPVVRKVWPQTLISSSRLLEGRFNDPLVGRDMLAGSVAALLVTILLQLKLVVHSLLEESIHYQGVMSAKLMIGIRELIGTAALAHGLAFFLAFFVMMILLVNRIMFRTERGALIGAQVFLTPFVAIAIGGNIAIAIPVALIMTSTILFLLVRFGLLAALTFFTCRMLLVIFPLTIDTSKWYFADGLAALVLIAVIAGVGCYFATTGRSTELRTAA